MFKDDWDSISGNSSKDKLLATIETENINLLMKRLSRLERCESYLESYIRDRKREISNLSKPQDEENYIEQILLKAFSTRRLSKEEEQELSRNTYLWYKVKEDPEVFDAIKQRVMELEYDETDDESRSTNVRTMSALMNFIPDADKWNELRDEAVKKIGEFNFTDLMLFSTSCSSYYIFCQKGFDQILLDKIPTLSVEQMCYYLQRTCDAGDGHNPKIQEAKQKRIRELNNPFVLNYAEECMDLEKMQGLSKLKTLHRYRSNSTYIPTIYFDDENVEEAREKEEAELKRIINEKYDSEPYKEYIRCFKELSPTETVQFLSYTLNNSGKCFLEKESEVIKEKLEHISKDGLLVTYLSSLDGRSEEDNVILQDENLRELFVRKGVINSETNEIIASDEEIQKAKEMSQMYCEEIDKNHSYRVSWHKVNFPTLEAISEYDEGKIEDELLHDYTEARDSFEQDLSFIKDVASLDKCKDVQLINIINRMNTSSTENLQEEQNYDDVDRDKAENRKWLDNYLKSRILTMKPGVASMLTVPENGRYTKHIETAMNQAEFEEKNEPNKNLEELEK